MPYRRSCAACALAAALLLSGCSAVTGSDVESLLRAPQASGETSAVQKALNSALGVTATLKYPASGDFLSPLLFGDWDGDGQDEAAVLYTLDASAGNVYLAILEPTEENGWRVTQTAEGLSSEVESVNTAHLRDENSLQILVGYASAQGDRYMVVYLYTEDGLQIIIKQAYTEMILANLTGGVRQHRTIPALRLKHRSGGCGTASALPKCSIMSGCGTRIVLRGQKPLALCDRCPCFGSLFPPLAALTFAASSIICAFGLASAAPRSPYRHLELCGIALKLSLCETIRRGDSDIGIIIVSAKGKAERQDPRPVHRRRRLHYEAVFGVGADRASGGADPPSAPQRHCGR